MGYELKSENAAPLVALVAHLYHHAITTRKWHKINHGKMSMSAINLQTTEVKNAVQAWKSRVQDLV